MFVRGAERKKIISKTKKTTPKKPLRSKRELGAYMGPLASHSRKLRLTEINIKMSPQFQKGRKRAANIIAAVPHVDAEWDANKKTGATQVSFKRLNEECDAFRVGFMTRTSKKPRIEVDTFLQAAKAMKAQAIRDALSLYYREDVAQLQIIADTNYRTPTNAEEGTTNLVLMMAEHLRLTAGRQEEQRDAIAATVCAAEEELVDTHINEYEQE